MKKAVPTHKGRRLLVGLLLVVTVITLALFSYGKKEPVEVRQQQLVIAQTPEIRLTLKETSVLTSFDELRELVGSRVYVVALFQQSKLYDRNGLSVDVSTPSALEKPQYYALEIAVDSAQTVTVLEVIDQLDDPYADRGLKLLTPLAETYADCSSCQAKGLDCLKFARVESAINLDVASSVYNVEYRLVNDSSETMLATTYDLAKSQSVRSVISTNKVDCVTVKVEPALEEPTGIYRGQDFDSDYLNQEL